ncbi:Enterochelin esterase [Lachnospiraceae bacterium XBD2001]|nr:Enterochelin esterase [Lachnospiraceae bacterium XBD2001]
MKDLNVQALAYNPVIVPAGQPQAITYEEGKTILRLSYPHATSVSLVTGEKEYPFAKTEDCWELVFPVKSGINYVQILVDGDEVLSPYLPIGYGYSRPYNYVEQPVEGCERWSMEGVRHGTLHHEIIYSMVTGTYERCVVYTPFGYEMDEREYPVLYLQHGHGENEIGWTTAGKVQFILDHLIAEGDATPMIVVMNNGMVQQRDASGKPYVDHLLFEQYLLEDVMPLIEHKYRIKKGKENRAMAGLSMGSIQTAITTFQHPEQFGAVGIFSGFLHDWITSSELDTNNRGPSENRHLKILDDAKTFSENFDVFFRGIGKEDPFLEYFLEDDALLEEKGISCTRRIYEGTHDWNVWRGCIYDFARLIFK